MKEFEDTEDMECVRDIKWINRLYGDIENVEDRAKLRGVEDMEDMEGIDDREDMGEKEETERLEGHGG